MLMMRPAPCRRIWGTTARVIRTIPKKFVSKIDRACSIELSSAPAGATPKPALFTSTSIRSARRTTSLTAASTDRSLVTSRVSISNDRRPAGRRSSAGTEDPVASRGQPLRGGFADARRGARHNRCLALHCVLSCTRPRSLLSPDGSMIIRQSREAQAQVQPPAAAEFSSTVQALDNQKPDAPGPSR